MISLMLGALLVGHHFALGREEVRVPVMPTDYTMSITLSMPFLGLEVPMGIATSIVRHEQKIDYYNSIEVDKVNSTGTYKLVFNGSSPHEPPKRVCQFKPYVPVLGEDGKPVDPTGTPKLNQFFPDLSLYGRVQDEPVRGILCHRYDYSLTYGTTGTTDDHMSFYWDPAAQKPVRWHQHGRQAPLHFHSDEYIIDYLAVQVGVPDDAGMELSPLCHHPIHSDHVTAANVMEYIASRRPVSRDENLTSWQFSAFVNRFGKSYSSAGERARRRRIFEENALKLSALNLRHAGRTSFKPNQYLDMTHAEIRQLRGGTIELASPEANMAMIPAEYRALLTKHRVALEVADLPRDFDWRTARAGVVGRVKDQLWCGSCWAHGLMGSIESRWALKTGHFVQLPEQFAVDCTWSLMNWTGPTHGSSLAGTFGCDGGTAFQSAFMIISNWGGRVPSARAYGQTLGIDGYCRDSRRMELGAHIDHWVYVPASHYGDPSYGHALMDALASGPVAVGITVSEAMHYYDSGIFDDENCACPGDINHFVVGVGYGSENGKDYWLLKNSWSAYWGDEGYIKVVQGKNDCCVTIAAGYAAFSGEATSLLTAFV